VLAKVQKRMESPIAVAHEGFGDLQPSCLAILNKLLDESFISLSKIPLEVRPSIEGLIEKNVLRCTAGRKVTWRYEK